MLSDIGLRVKWPKAKHHKNDLYPLKLVKFGHLQVYSVLNPVLYLDGTYPEWRTVNRVYVRDAKDPKNVKHYIPKGPAYV